MFITIEGCEAGGKSTQARILTNKMNTAGYITKLDREPGSTPVAEKIRDILKSDAILTLEQQFLLFHAARIDHINHGIIPSKILGHNVVCDRYMDSTYVYQNSVMTEDEWTNYYVDIENKGGYPDLTFILDMDPEKSIARMSSRTEKDHWDNESVQQMRAKRALFLRLGKRYDYARSIYIIDADRSEKEISDEIFYITLGEMK